MRFLITLLIIICEIFPVYAYELILPKEKDIIINSNYIFFVGNAKKNETISINDENIYIAPNGAFAHSVKLKEGENRIFLRSMYNRKTYKFYKPKISVPEKPKLVEFEPRLYVVLKDNTPIRKTPVDYGMNRISHLFKGTNLLINGQFGDFYRVYLSKNDTAWISVNSVIPSENKIFLPAFTDMNSQTFKNASVHKLVFTENLPYVVEENKNEIIFKTHTSSLSNDSVYSMNIKKPEKYTYKTSLTNGTYEFKVNELPIGDIEYYTVVIDAGHGGAEDGAIGCLGDKEKDINLAIANELKSILEKKGIKVLMTRECDATVSLDDRVLYAQENNANIFVSIHLNSIPDIKMNINKHRGTSVYYYNNNSKNLAKLVNNSLTKTLYTRNDGVKTASFAVIRPTDYVGILVEVAYMTNPKDSVIYKSKHFPQNAATGIANGILNYINSGKDIK